MHSRQHPGVLEKGKGQWLCWGQACAKCRLQGSRTFKEVGVSTQSVGFEVLVPRRKLPAGLLRTQRKDSEAVSRGSQVAGFWGGPAPEGQGQRSKGPVSLAEAAAPEVGHGG